MKITEKNKITDNQFCYFRTNLKFIRAHLNLSQKELAEKLHVTHQTISRLEVDTFKPRLSTAIAIAEVFGCDVELLFQPSLAKVIKWLEQQSDYIN